MTPQTITEPSRKRWIVLTNKLQNDRRSPYTPLGSHMRVAQLKRDSTLNVKGRYARGFISLRRYMFAKLYCRCRLRGFERKFCERCYPLPRKRRFNVFGLIRLFGGSNDSVALTSSRINLLHRYNIWISRSRFDISNFHRRLYCLLLLLPMNLLWCCKR